MTNFGMRASVSPNEVVNECAANAKREYLLIGRGLYFCASKMSVALLFGGGGGGGGAWGRGCWYCGVVPLGVGAGAFITTGTKC